MPLRYLLQDLKAALGPAHNQIQPGVRVGGGGFPRVQLI
jgi:hypothetical protein